MQPWIGRAVVGLALMLPTTAAAEKDLLWDFSSGNWYGGAYADESGQFSHCSIAVSYLTGIAVAIAINSDWELQLALGNPKWELPVSSTYEVGLLIDGRSSGRFPATATTQSRLQIEVGDRADVYDRLRTGYTLTIAAEQDDLAFSLDGTYQALQRVAECAALASALSPKSSNPFASSGEKTFGTASTNPFASRSRSSDREVVELLLAAAGLEKTTFVPPNTLQAEDAAHAWISRDMSGAVWVYPAEGDLDEVSQAVLGEIAKGCEGAFASEANPPARAGFALVKSFSAGCVTGSEQMFIAATAAESRGTVLFFLHFTSGNVQRLRAVNDQLSSVMSILLQQK